MTEQVPHASLSGRVARGVTIATAGSLLSKALTLAMYVVLARLAHPETFGTFTAASVLVWFGALFVESGMTAAVIHRTDRIEEAASTALLSTLASGVALSLLAVATAPLVGLYFRSHEVAVVAAALAGLHLLNAATVVPEAMFQRRFSFVRRTVVDPLSVIAYGTSAAIGLAYGLGVWGLVLGVYASEVVRVSLDWALSEWRPDVRRASWRMWRELAAYARHVFTGEILRQTGGVLNTALIGRFLGRAELAQWGFGYRLATEGSAPIFTAVSFVLFPALARISAEKERFAKAVLQSYRYGCFVIFPVSLILFSLGEPLAVLLLGERWRAAGTVVSALAPVGAALSLRSISSEVFKASGNPQRLPRIYMLSAVLPALAVLVGIHFGLVAIAAGVSAAYVVVAVYSTATAARLAGILPGNLIRAMSPPALASAAMTAVLYPLEHLAVHSADRGTLEGFALLSAEVILGTAIYLAVVYLVDPALPRGFFHNIRAVRKRRAHPEKTTRSSRNAASEAD
jgi:O-antigen/teichoic acid export membrane protein